MDKRLSWCRENIPGFKAMHDQAVKSAAEAEKNRQEFTGRRRPDGTVVGEPATRTPATPLLGMSNTTA